MFAPKLPACAIHSGACLPTCAEPSPGLPAPRGMLPGGGPAGRAAAGGKTLTPATASRAWPAAHVQRSGVRGALRRAAARLAMFPGRESA
jgi:hypothetical protein